MADFEKAYALTMKAEGGWANDPDDSGGETWAGIARNYHPAWAGWPVIDQIKKSTPRANWDKAMFANADLLRLKKQFYKNLFWDVYRLDQVNDQSIANELFDTGVNCGTGVAATFLQRALNVTNENQKLYPDLVVDGMVGPATVNTLNKHPFPALVLKALNILQGYRYITLAEKNPSQEKFMRSWLSRVSL